MKYAVLAFGLWLAGAQGVVTQACLPGVASQKADCGSCDGRTGSDTSCCITVKAQKDVDAAIPKNDPPEKPAPMEFVVVETGTASWPEATDQTVRMAGVRAEGPPLYLRYEVLLI